MKSKLWCFLCFCHFSILAQTDSLYVQIDTTIVVMAKNALTNPTALNTFFNKLSLLEKNKKGKINIVHIGDSHIQADLFSGYNRTFLLQKFGNGGRGFVFPHTLAKTNGTSDVRFSSNQVWESQRNIYPDVGNPVGLSGFALFTKKNDFAIEMNLKDKSFGFSLLKIITPQNQKMFDVALASKTIKLESDISKKIIHKIKSGENLSVIADKYNLSIQVIKAANGLKNNSIRAGKTLKIPSNEKNKNVVERSEFIPLITKENDGYHLYESDSILDKIYLIPAIEKTEFAINGLVLENNLPGVVYHTIGVNGAKCSDYNKYPLFFEQLKVLSPDLVIISLGTNESFDKLNTLDYITQLNLMIDSIRVKNPSVVFLITTPPPSQFKGKFPNTFVADYARKIITQSVSKEYAVWDLFSVSGGLFSISQSAKTGLIGADKVHYTKIGYEKQGQLFMEAFFESYKEYKTLIEK